MSQIPDTSLISQVGKSIDSAAVIALPDPSKVKAGDTARVEVIPVNGPRYWLTGDVRQVGASLWIGPVCIDMPADDIERVTLTDHQPAPEPEPEWKDGQIGDALVHGASVRGFISNDGESFVFSVPGGGYHEAGHGSFEDFVPLVVIDPAVVVDELVDSLSHALGERLSEETLAFINRVSGGDRRKWVRGLLSHAQPNLVRSAFQVLGIEVPR